VWDISSHGHGSRETQPCSPIRQTCQWLERFGPEARSVNTCTPRSGRCLSHSPPNPFFLSLLPRPSRRDASQLVARCSRGMPASRSSRHAQSASCSPSCYEAQGCRGGGEMDDPMRWHECVHGSLRLDLDGCRQCVRACLVFRISSTRSSGRGHGRRRHPRRLPVEPPSPISSALP